VDDETTQETHESDKKSKRGRGRPRGRHDPSINWDEIETTFVHGVKVEEGDNGQAGGRRWLSFRELGERFGVSHALVHKRAQRYGWTERRDKFKATFRELLDEEVAKHLATSTADVVAIIDGWIRDFATSVREGKVRHDAIADLNTAARLREFLLGNADARSEQNVSLSLDEMQSRHRELKTIVEAHGVEQTGMIEGGAPLDDEPRELPSPLPEGVAETSQSRQQTGEGEAKAPTIGGPDPSQLRNRVAEFP
jgi:hypothetical protein